MPKKTPRKLDTDTEFRPAYDPEVRQNQMISLAVDLAEKQLRDGTASAQVITHYLKLGTERERHETEMLKKQEKLIDAKIEALHSNARSEELYANAIAAMGRYVAHGDMDDEDEKIFGID